MPDQPIDLSDGLVPKDQPIDLSDGLVPKDTPPPVKSRFSDRISAAIADPSNVPDTGWRGQIEKFGQGAAQGLTQPFLHPLDTLGSMAEATPAGAVFDLATGRKNASQQQAEDLVNGMRTNPAGTLGNVAGGVAAGGVVGAGADAVGATSRFARNFRPTSAPNVVPPAEAAARELTNAINPEPKRAPNYIQAAQQEVPNILDYAKRNNNPLRTQLEFSKAAEGYAKEARDHYEDNVLGPNENQKVPAPAGYGGKSIPAGENPQNRVTTLKNIDDRIVDINKELNSPRLNATDQRSAMASQPDLLAEKSQLTDLLHRSLSDLTGMSPDDVANLRQRVGRARELSNDTNAAVTGRGLKDAKPIAGGSLPTSMGDVAMRGINEIVGGPTAISDRAFQKAIKNFPGQATPLPQVTGPKAPQVPSNELSNVFSGDRLQNLARQKAAQAPANVSPINSGPTPNVGDVQPPVRPLDKSAAQDIYNRSGKDPVKARELAKKEGYTW